jgi:hypothetical protein
LLEAAVGGKGGEGEEVLGAIKLLVSEENGNDTH